MSQIKFAIKKSQLKIVLLFILFKLVLDLSYLYVVSPRYAYSGFTLSIEPFALIESYIFVIILGLVIQARITRPSHFFNWMLAVVTLIPTLSYYAMHSGSRAFMYGMVFCFLFIVAFNKLPMIRVWTLKEGRTIGIVIMIIMVCVVTASLIIKGGLSHFNLDLSKVYDHRREVGSLINVGVWGYIDTWTFKVINPALIGWLLAKTV